MDAQVITKVAALALTVIVLWSGVLFWAVKWLLDRYQRSIEQRLEGLETCDEHTDQRQRDVEKQILELKTELAKEYVHREDWIRGWNTVEAKLDAVYGKVDEIKDRVYARN
jgi:F0F1-type ATP synthase membrane subunit b/b'